MKQFDVAIVGGGIAGLVASIDLAREGKSVVLFEKSSQLGGRAISVKKNGAFDQLYETAVRSGVSVITGKNATEIEHDGAVRKIKFADGQEMDVTHVISATPPAVTSRLLGAAGCKSVLRWKEQARAIEAASLTLSLKRLSAPDHFAVLGLDQPVYFINQSKFTRLSEDGASVVNITKANGTGGTDAKADERFLERTLDLIQPGWRKEVVARQYLPHIAVAYDFMNAGREDRFPGPAVPEIAGLYVAGEWATHGENLADAAAASGRRAVRRVLKDMEAVRSGRETILV